MELKKLKDFIIACSKLTTKKAGAINLQVNDDGLIDLYFRNNGSELKTVMLSTDIIMDGYDDIEWENQGIHIPFETFFEAVNSMRCYKKKSTVCMNNCVNLSVRDGRLDIDTPCGRTSLDYEIAEQVEFIHESKVTYAWDYRFIDDMKKLMPFTSDDEYKPVFKGFGILKPKDDTQYYIAATDGKALGFKKTVPIVGGTEPKSDKDFHKHYDLFIPKEFLLFDGLIGEDLTASIDVERNKILLSSGDLLFHADTYIFRFPYIFDVVPSEDLRYGNITLDIKALYKEVDTTKKGTPVDIEVTDGKVFYYQTNTKKVTVNGVLNDSSAEKYCRFSIVDDMLKMLYRFGFERPTFTLHAKEGEIKAPITYRDDEYTVIFMPGKHSSGTNSVNPEPEKQQDKIVTDPVFGTPVPASKYTEHQPVEETPIETEPEPVEEITDKPTEPEPVEDTTDNGVDTEIDKRIGKILGWFERHPQYTPECLK